MHTKRLVIIIGLITFLGLITAWQQVQTIRWGYQISELATLRDKLFTGEQSIKIKLANLKSPQNLMIYAQSKQIHRGCHSGFPGSYLSAF
ncbi:MAG: hypothetical protein HY762_01075 [Planctomycetes bacterium]|nr:hypothetical protein [Planctomycetota bacterium]